jgi:hypothetical protein
LGTTGEDQDMTEQEWLDNVTAQLPERDLEWVLDLARISSTEWRGDKPPTGAAGEPGQTEVLVSGYAFYSRTDEFGESFCPSDVASTHPMTAPSTYACGVEAGNLPVSILG